MEEAFNAVRYIGDAEWLDGVYEGYGAQESADRWLEDFLIGTPVPDKEEAESNAGNASDGCGDESEEGEPDVNAGQDPRLFAGEVSFLASVHVNCHRPSEADNRR